MECKCSIKATMNSWFAGEFKSIGSRPLLCVDFKGIAQCKQRIEFASDSQKWPTLPNNQHHCLQYYDRNNLKLEAGPILMYCIFLPSYFIYSMQSIQNLGLALINMAAGVIVDAKGYLFLEVFFCAWLCRKYNMSFYMYCIFPHVYLYVQI